MHFYTWKTCLWRTWWKGTLVILKSKCTSDFFFWWVAQQRRKNLRQKNMSTKSWLAKKFPNFRIFSEWMYFFPNAMEYILFIDFETSRHLLMQRKSLERTSSCNLLAQKVAWPSIPNVPLWKIGCFYFISSFFRNHHHGNIDIPTG